MIENQNRDISISSSNVPFGDKAYELNRMSHSLNKVTVSEKEVLGKVTQNNSEWVTITTNHIQATSGYAELEFYSDKSNPRVEFSIIDDYYIEKEQGSQTFEMKNRPTFCV